MLFDLLERFGLPLAVAAMAGIALAGSGVAAETDLPRKAPLPVSRPAQEPVALPKTAGGRLREPAEIPLPTPRPDRETAKPALGMAPPDEPWKRIPGATAKTLPKLQFPPRPPTSPAEEAVCRKRLRALGAKFEERPPISDPLGCAIARPILLKELGGGIDIEPDALLNCSTADAIARFSRNTMSKLAGEQFGATVKSIAQASAYVCRPRNGTSKLSEHAFGNALDIARIELSDGATVDVNATRNPQRSLFLSKLRTAACGPFKTVLGPGSDADHAAHFHLDLASRRNGSTFCQ
jgi:hypothetical protein